MQNATEILTEMQALLRPFCDELAIKNIEKQQLTAIAEHLALAMEWTKRIDLIGPGSVTQRVSRHAVDSVLAYVELCKAGVLADIPRMVDVGSGGGFPGIPFAILFPSKEVVLVEKRNKRVIFLREVMRRLSLENVRVLESDLSEVSPLPSATAFTARAFGQREFLREECRRIASSGLLIELLTEGDETPEVVNLPYSLPPDSASRCLSVCSWSAF